MKKATTSLYAREITVEIRYQIASTYHSRSFGFWLTKAVKRLRIFVDRYQGWEPEGDATSVNGRGK